MSWDPQHYDIELISELFEDFEEQATPLYTNHLQNVAAVLNEKLLYTLSGKEKAAIAHEYKGSCLNLGMSKIASLFAQIETEPDAFNEAEWDEHIACLRQELQFLQSDLVPRLP